MAEVIQVHFTPRDSWGPRKVEYKTGSLSIPPYKIKEFELYVAPVAEKIEGDGTVLADFTYVAKEKRTNRFRIWFDRNPVLSRLTYLGPKEMYSGRVDLERLGLIINGDILCSAVAECIENEARTRKIPCDRDMLDRMLQPVAKNYLEIFTRMQEHHTRIITKKDVEKD